MDQPVNGHGAVDLAAVKAAAAQKEQLDAQRGDLEAQPLTQAGLQCPCGERIRGCPTVYYGLVEGQVPTPQGPQLGLNLVMHTCCSTTCPAAMACELEAVARRRGPAGEITWLDERRAARALLNGNH